VVKNRDGPLLVQTRGDPRVKLKARGDPYPGNCNRSRAPTEYAHKLSFNRLFLPEWERYEQLTMSNEQLAMNNEQ